MNTAFDEFMRDKVSLLASDTTRALASRDWLFKQIHSFPDTFSDFPLLYEEKDIAFGSFARKTKIRPLDDIDIISGLHGTGGVYTDNGHGRIRIRVLGSSRLSAFCDRGSDLLNSKRVVNRYVKALSSVPQYASADINRRGEGAVLRLTSYDWNFDVIPGFFTTQDAYGRTYYLIPDGSGDWKKTDPRRDRDRLSTINQAHDGNVLNVIRATKYWHRRPTMPTASSYTFETIVTDFYAGNARKATAWVDVELGPVLRHIARAILNDVQDPKGIQGNLNSLSWDDRNKIRDRALLDAQRAAEARVHENAGDHERAINKWREVFGTDFPRFS